MGAVEAAAMQMAREELREVAARVVVGKAA